MTSDVAVITVAGIRSRHGGRRGPTAGLMNEQRGNGQWQGNQRSDNWRQNTFQQCGQWKDDETANAGMTDNGMANSGTADGGWQTETVGYITSVSTIGGEMIRG